MILVILVILLKWSLKESLSKLQSLKYPFQSIASKVILLSEISLIFYFAKIRLLPKGSLG